MNGKVKSITISNYQSIKDAVIELGDITVITGKSRAGKSAFYRSVKGAVENQDGDDYITVGEKETYVWIDDVCWIQGKGKNDYNACGEIFQKCGRTVPEKVREFINMGEVEFSKDLKENLNFYDQLGNIFIVQGKGADNAKIIGSIFGVEKVYNALREAESDTKKTKKGISEAVKSIERAKDELNDKRGTLDNVSALHGKLEGIYNEVRDLDEHYAKLTSRLDKYNNSREKLFDTARKLKKYLQIDFDSALKEVGKIEEICRGVDRYNKIKEDIDKREVLYSSMESIDFDSVDNDVEWIRRVEPALFEYNMRLASFINTETSVKGIDVLLEKMDAELNNIDVCETCGAEKENWNL
jgi:DNA repair ATPase RecN